MSEKPEKDERDPRIKGREQALEGILRIRFGAHKSEAGARALEQLRSGQPQAAPVSRPRVRRKKASRSGLGRLGAGFLLAAAAAAVIIIGLKLYKPATVDPVLPVSGAFAVLIQPGMGTTVKREDRVLKSETNMALRAGDCLSTQGGGVLTFKDDGSRTELSEASELVLRPASGHRFELVTGRVVCLVRPQEEGRAFDVLTREAEVRVLGTRFSLETGTGQSRLEVSEGRVNLTRRSDQASIEVEAGQFAIAGEGIELAAQLLKPEPAARFLAEMDPSRKEDNLPRGWRTVKTLSIQEGIGQRWRIIDGASYGVTVPVLIQENNTTRAATLALKESIPHRAVIEGRFRITDSAKGGIILYIRFNDPANHYAFSVSRNGSKAYVNHGAADPDIFLNEVKLPGFTPDTWHSYRIELNGSEYVFILDGRELHRFSDTRITGGSFALVTHRSIAVFDRVTIRE